MNYSYVMGIGKKIYSLKSKEFIIKRKRKDYMVTFADEKANIWEEFICEHLQEGYWNEYINGDKVVFLFHLDSGIKRYEVENFENDEVLALCEKICDSRFESIKSMLAGNKFYKKILQ